MPVARERRATQKPPKSARPDLDGSPCECMAKLNWKGRPHSVPLLRCSSVTYSRYAPSSALRAWACSARPRRAPLAPRTLEGTRTGASKTSLISRSQH